MAPPAAFPRLASRLSPWLVTLTRVYFTLLFGQTALRLAGGDRWWWLVGLNMLTPYTFLPLPLGLGVALWTRRRDVWLGVGLGAALWAGMYGGLFLPPLPTAHAAGAAFRVMTYNMLGFNTDNAAALRVLRNAPADVVAMQELNLEHAAAIQRELKDIYPYQILDPQDGATGLGVISRYPLQPTGEHLTGAWMGTPLVLTVTVEGRAVTVVCFHTYAGINNAAPRGQQADILAAFAAAHATRSPLVAAGDLNATDMNEAYAHLMPVLHDSWREAGWGLGHTFPGAADTPGNTAPRLPGGWALQWLMRIDYVFYAGDLVALSAHAGPWDGASDHRAMVAVLALTK